jgi:RNA polymerase sigma factor (sigma-70 family)
MASSPERDGTSGIPPAADKAAFIESLSRQFRSPLVRFFEKRIGRQPDIEDLVQEVFLRLARGGQVESVDQPEAYLFRTAANLLYDRQRSLTVRGSENESYDDDLHGSARETSSPERALLGTQAIEQLVAALYELPDRTMTIWALYHLEDLSHAEIAGRLGVTVSTIEKHMSRAGAHLLKRLDRSI